MPAHGTNRISKLPLAPHLLSRSGVHQTKPYTAPELHGLRPPMKRLAAGVKFLLISVNRHRHLEAVVFVIGNMRVVRQVHVTDGNRREQLRSHCAAALVCLANGFVYRIDLKTDRHFRFKMEVARQKSMPVGVDEISRNVFAQC